ncbi:MAG TPA: bifunctional (p)ppGpp synthetase/guanosine-3',5'-bis(diphosphate) 3'-pyrophosphohydrolase [Firmicutes bacterium]|nr:bifunctional (p)ppGpp synthetase/guanosine-3',5'-bis(diphosphate) 3'-pyrophosphohydrolase [Bacillota bacterium]
MKLEELCEKVKSYNPSADLALVAKAYDFAAIAHAGQFRISGDPYIQHPLGVAHILTELELDAITIAASLLHDVVEDTKITLQDIQEEFNKEIALLVDGVTKLSRIEYKSKEEQQVENLRKMFFAMAKDIRVILIKLADRLHNLRTLKYLPVRKQKKIAQETLDVYAPLAHRLGIFRIKWELEDTAFRYLEPEKYYDLVEKVAKKRPERESYINQVIGILEPKLEEVGIQAEIQGRPKHLYSIYQKMAQQNIDFREIYDLTAIRVIVDTIKDCYGVLGVVHTLWKPVPGRFKDYIAMPKINMYQSLHTTVIGPQGEPLEIQIRTWEMHRTAEYGIAAHWRYKEGSKDSDEFDKKLLWLRQLLEWQHDLRDAREFMETLKIDLFADEVFVFTPRGDVIDLPAGSCPIDFAYRIHTDIGHRCIGAKVNGHLVPLDYKLQNGDIVEIVTSKLAAGPSRDWLKLVRTPQAKAKIRQWFKKERKEESVARGRETLEKEIRKLGYEPHELLADGPLEAVLERLSFSTTEDLLASVGYGGLSVNQVITRLREEYRRLNPEIEAQMAVPDLKPRPQTTDVSRGVKVKGVDNLLIRLSHCCNPVPGDPIIGYITRGRGVSVHRVNCPNVAFLSDPERLIEVSWDQDQAASFAADVELAAMDRPELLSDVMNVLSDMRTRISAVNARTTRDMIAIISLRLEIRNLEELKAIINRLSSIRDVFSVERVSPA